MHLDFWVSSCSYSLSDLGGFCRVDYSEYFSRIEKAFQKHRKSNVFLTPLDWGIVESWFNRGVPLSVILGTIDEVFSHLDERKKRKLGSLRYFQREVEIRFKKCHFPQVGSHEDESDGFKKMVLAHFQEKIEILSTKVKNFSREDLRRSLEQIVADLVALKEEIVLTQSFSSRGTLNNSNWIDQVESGLEELDNRLMMVVLKSSDEKVRQKCRDWAEKQAAKYKRRVPQEVYQKTLEVLFLKALRSEYDLPKLSLFEL